MAAKLGALRSPLHLIFRYRKILLSVARVEFAKRYSGSAFGRLWVLLYPALLLAMYLFVYVVVFQLRFSDGSPINYVVYVFCGLIPYIGFMEAVSSGCTAIKQNIHLVRNVMLPIELIPLRYVLMSIITETIGLGILLVLSAWNGSLGWNLLGLPFAVLVQMMLLAGIVWFLAPLALVLPDTSYFVNLLVMLLMFISPIGFRPDMIHGVFRLALYLNPVYYMIEVFRGTVINGHSMTGSVVALYVGISVVVFFCGNAFFRRVKNVLADYE
jgi:lipopolysaccharide transport system permease protein